MVKYALIRDDDVNFFTSPDMLDKIYREIFSMGIPVNLSIIPYVKSSIKIKNNPYSEFNGLKYEPFIPKKYRCKNLCFCVCENRQLFEFFENIKGYMEIIQHGFSHSPNEFSSLNAIELERKIINGRKILKQAFNVYPKFFSAPYDDYSPLSFLLLKKHFYGVTYGEFTLRNMLSLRCGTKIPLDMIPRYLNAMKRGAEFFVIDNFLVLGHRGTSINPFVDIDKFKCDFKENFKKQKIITIMHHHWEYFYFKEQGCIGDSINKKLFETFVETIQWLKERDVKFLTVSQLYKKLRA